MDKDYDGRITVDEFINVFLEAEEILNNKIKDIRNIIEDHHRQRNEAFMKLEEIKQTENLNEFGICQNSQLNVVVMQISDFVSHIFDSFYVMIECGEQNSKSNICYFSNPKIDFNNTLLFFIFCFLKKWFFYLVLFIMALKI